MDSRPPDPPEVPLPDLRIVPIGWLLPHELHDEQRAGPLVRRMREDGVLRNPPIVTPLGLGDNRFVILDGANRVVALDVLGIGHVLVQVVPYEPPRVELHTWHHGLSHVDVKELYRRLKQLDGIEIAESDIFHARAALARRAILAYCLLADGRVYTLAGGGFDLHQRTRLLRAIVESYIGMGQLSRLSTDHLDRLMDLYPDLAAAIIFPRYEPVEILDLARSGLRVPPGLTRHVIQGRALRVNYPLERLAALTDLETKNGELAKWLQERFGQRRVRYYAESTYLFDE